MSTAPQLYRFTVDDVLRMIQTGILPEDARVELIDGILHEMIPIGPAYGDCVTMLTELLSGPLRGRARVQVQSAIRLGEALFQPDVAVLRLRPRPYYRTRRPGAADIELLIEVCDASAAGDRTIKYEAYASAAIPEVWFVDLPAEVVVVARDPVGTDYTDRRDARRGDIVTVPSIPDVVLSVEEILGPRIQSEA